MYLKTSTGDASGLGAVITAMPQVAEVDFVSLEEARTRVASDFKDAPGLIPEMQANARSGFEIWLKDVWQSENLASELRTHSEVDEATTGRTDAVEAAEGLLDAFYHKSLTATSAAAQDITVGSEQRKPGSASDSPGHLILSTLAVLKPRQVVALPEAHCFAEVR